MCSLSKEQFILSRETIQNAYSFRMMPLFRLRLFILYQAPHSQALAPVCDALFSFRKSVLGETLQSPYPVLVKPRKDMKNVSCRRDVTEILLKGA